MPVMVEPEKKGKKDKKPKKPAAGGVKDPAAEGKDFTHLVRLAGVVVDGRLPLPKALMKIKGVGPRVAESLIMKLGLPVDTRVGTMNEEQLAQVEGKLGEINTLLPAWMLNRRRDFESGADLHRIGPELDIQKREDINREKKIKSYRGVRHSFNLPVRGQRTRSSFRTGSTVGVSRKKGGFK